MNPIPTLTPKYNASEVLFHNLEAGRGDKIAIYYEDEQHTYAQLCESACRIGNALKNLGVPTGSRVMMLIMDTPQFPATFFGTMRAGYIPIPTNTVLPPDNYAYFLQDSEAKVAIVSAPLYEKIAQIRDRCPALEHMIVIGGEASIDTLAFDAITTAASPALDPASSRHFGSTAAAAPASPRASFTYTRISAPRPKPTPNKFSA